MDPNGARAPVRVSPENGDPDPRTRAAELVSAALLLRGVPPTLRDRHLYAFEQFVSCCASCKLGQTFLSWRMTRQLDS